LHGEHTVVHGGETSGNRLVRPRVRGDDRISDDDIGAWRLMELLFFVASRHVARAQDASLHRRSFACFQISKGVDRFELHVRVTEA
jgi:hypothetical protein